MTAEQVVEIKRICGDLEESNQSLGEVKDQLQMEWDEMTGDQQAEDPDLDNLIGEIDDLIMDIPHAVAKVMDRLGDEEGGVGK